MENKSPYTDMDMKEFKKICLACVRDWKKRLKLDWTIEVSCKEDNDGEGWNGKVNFDHENRVAWLMLCKESSRPIEDVIAHEMVHVFLASIHEAIEDVCDAMEGIPRRTVWNMFETVLEERVEALRALLGNKGKKKFTDWAGHSEWHEV